MAKQLYKIKLIDFEFPNDPQRSTNGEVMLSRVPSVGESIQGAADKADENLYRVLEVYHRVQQGENDPVAFLVVRYY